MSPGLGTGLQSAEKKGQILDFELTGDDDSTLALGSSQSVASSISLK